MKALLTAALLTVVSGGKSWFCCHCGIDQSAMPVSDLPSFNADYDARLFGTSDAVDGVHGAWYGQWREVEGGAGGGGSCGLWADACALSVYVGLVPVDHACSLSMYVY